MDILEIGSKLLASKAGGAVITIGERLFYSDVMREPLVRFIEQRLQANLNKNGHLPVAWRKIARERKLMGLALFHAVGRALRQETLSPQVAHGLVDVFGRTLLLQSGKRPAHQRFRDKYGYAPPWFITISPGHACNLRCKGCYADSGPSARAAKLPWPIFDRIITEAKELWGSRFIVISGGEPLAYRSDGKGLLDAVEKHSDCIFLMYTNGTLIDKEIAARMAKLGNITPAISVEGMRGRTDERRGAGVFDRVLQAMANLREVGVPFGISTTPTRFNCQEILSDEFLDFFFGEQGVFYGFMFHYMPIGRSFTLDLMPTPEQRIWMWRRSWEVIEKRRIFLIDFWNQGPLVQGCISAGRQGGYIYIDWNGKVMPCVFAPYSAANILDIYAKGGTLNDVWNLPFFEAIRQWQREYGFNAERPFKEGNWLRTCPIRDHYKMYRQLIERYGPEPEDKAAQEALEDEDYYKGLVAYGIDYGECSQDIWEREYLGQR